MDYGIKLPIYSQKLYLKRAVLDIAMLTVEQFKFDVFSNEFDMLII